MRQTDSPLSSIRSSASSTSPRFVPSMTWNTSREGISSSVSPEGFAETFEKSTQYFWSSTIFSRRARVAGSSSLPTWARLSIAAAAS